MSRRCMLPFHLDVDEVYVISLKTYIYIEREREIEQRKVDARLYSTIRYVEEVVGDNVSDC